MEPDGRLQIFKRETEKEGRKKCGERKTQAPLAVCVPVIFQHEKNGRTG